MWSCFRFETSLFSIILHVHISCGSLTINFEGREDCGNTVISFVLLIVPTIWAAKHRTKVHHSAKTSRLPSNLSSDTHTICFDACPPVREITWRYVTSKMGLLWQGKGVEMNVLRERKVWSLREELLRVVFWPFEWPCVRVWSVFTVFAGCGFLFRQWLLHSGFAWQVWSCGMVQVSLNIWTGLSEP